jgi:hypothetical protein
MALLIKFIYFYAHFHANCQTAEGSVESEIGLM